MPHTDSIWVSLRARQPNPSLPTRILSLHVFSRAHHRELSLESQINLPLFGCFVCIPVMSGCSAVSMQCTELVALSVLTRKSLRSHIVVFQILCKQSECDFFKKKIFSYTDQFLIYGMHHVFLVRQKSIWILESVLCADFHTESVFFAFYS